jgi:hypothetical protein
MLTVPVLRYMKALAALDRVAEEEAIPFADLAVVGAVFANDLARD